MQNRLEEILYLAHIARRERRLHDVRGLLLEAVAISPTPDLLAALGKVERDLGQLDAALAHYRDAASLYQSDGQLLSFAHTQRHVADIHAQIGDYAAAILAYSEPVEIYRQAAGPPVLDVANALRGLAIARENTGDRASALDLWREAGALYQEARVEAGAEESRRHVAQLSKGPSS